MVALTVYPFRHLPIFHFRFIFPFFFFFSVVSLSWRAFSIQCKTGWQEWNQACYKLTKDFTTFSNASSICRQNGAELVSIASLQENEFVHNVSEGEDVLIGLRAAKASDSFVWSDGSTFDYSRWEDGKPKGNCGVDGCCVILVETTGRWNDTPCEMWNPFVCKFTSAQPKLRPGNCLVFNRGGDDESVCCGIINISFKWSETAHRALTNKIPELGVNQGNIEESRAILEHEWMYGLLESHT